MPPNVEICSICKRSTDLEDIILYPVPKTKHKRTKWNSTCGKNFQDGDMVCEFHFTEYDFHFAQEQRVLRPMAVPSLKLHNVVLKSGLEHEQDESLDVKLESELITLATNLDSEIEDATAIPPPTEFINEELFDNNPSFLEHTSKAVQTGSSNSRACGLIEVTLDDEIYTINCFHCIEQFELPNISKFLTHLQHSHRLLSKTAEELNKACSEPCSPKIEIKRESSAELSEFETDDELRTRHSFKSCRTTLGSSNKELPVTEISSVLCKEEEAFEEVEPVSYGGVDTGSSSNEEADDDYVPTKHTQRNMLAYSDNETEKSSTTKANPDKQIVFGKTGHAIVMDYLELLKSLPPLWHSRIQSVNEFDAALQKLTKQLKAKHPTFRLTHKTASQSLSRIKNWFKRRLQHSEKEYTECHSKHRDYFNKCAEFLTKPMLKDVQPMFGCDLCDCIFAQDTDLQTHKYLQHKVGELPFPCIECEQRFESLRLAQRHMKEVHEEKPEQRDSRKIRCTECPRRFKEEVKLQAHMLKKHSESSFMCDVCGKSYTSLKILRKHKVGHAPPSQECHICKRRFIRAQTLKEHVKTHFDQRDYSCDICGKTFIRRRNWAQHTRIHTGKNSSSVAADETKPNCPAAENTDVIVPT